MYEFVYPIEDHDNPIPTWKYPFLYIYIYKYIDIYIYIYIDIDTDIDIYIYIYVYYIDINMVRTPLRGRAFQHTELFPSRSLLRFRHSESDFQDMMIYRVRVKTRGRVM